MKKEKLILLKQLNKIYDVLEETRSLINSKVFNKDFKYELVKFSGLVAEEKNQLDVALFYEKEELEIEKLNSK